MRTVFISVGHGEKKWYGGQDKGASYKGVNEFDMVSAVIDQLFKLQTPGVKLIRVPSGGSLASKIKFINKNCHDGDIALEFHMDSSANLKASGCSTWFMGGSDYAYRKAINFQLSYTRITGVPGRGIHPDTTNRWGRLGFVRDTKPLALLVEMGFLQSEEDKAMIVSSGAEGILQGIYSVIKS